MEELQMRRLCLALSSVMIATSLWTIYALQYVPNEPLHIKRNFTLYSILVLFASGAGHLGAHKRNATLVSLFASHLIVDSILYLVPRIILLNFSISLPAVLCAPPTPSTRNDDVYNVSPYSTFGRNFFESKRCQTMTWALETSVVSAAVFIMVLQFWLALKVRRYAIYLERIEEAKEAVVKAGKPTSLAYSEEKN